MGRIVKYEPCPNCRKEGRDRSGDNLARYADGGGFCFACRKRYRRQRSYLESLESPHPGHDQDGLPERSTVNASADEAVLPADFTREVPARAWKWLLQYGLPYSYWRPHCGYSEKDNRLLILAGTGAIGRYLGDDTGEKDATGQWVRKPPRKWWMYGKLHERLLVLGEAPQQEGPIVLVEDVISWHKVAQVATCVWLGGTSISKKVLGYLQGQKRPVVLWLDADQRGVLAPKINRLQTFLEAPVTFVSTEKDPKEYSVGEIKERLGNDSN